MSGPVRVQPQPQQQAMNVSNNVVVNVGPSHGGAAPRPWSSGLCGCLSDIPSCCCVCCFGQCYLCLTAAKMGEGCCLPMCNSPTVILALLRLKLRIQHNIHGSISDDLCMTCCCWPCAFCQLRRELNFVGQ